MIKAHMIWMGARHYDPISGRFLSTDPIGIPVSLNLYSYTNGDPINFNDPDGRFDSPVYKNSSLPTVCNFGIFEAMASPLNRSGWYDLSGKGLKELPNGLAIGFINGIQNSFDDFKESLLHLSKLSGGYNIQGVYGASVEPPCGEMFGLLGQRVIDTCRSFAGDLLTCLFGMLNVDTGRVQHLHAMWDAHFDRHPSGYFLQFYHSRGGIDMTNALLCYPKERRKKS